MKDDDTFSDNGPSPTTSAHERDRNSDGSTLSSSPGIPQDVPASTEPPLMERRLTPRHHVRLLLVALMVLVVLAGGYGVFRAVSPPSRQASSAFQQARCPFPLAGLVEGQNVKCGFLMVPEDRSQPQGPTIRLAVAIFKASDPHPAPDPILVLGGGPGMATLETLGPTYNVDLILLDQVE